jgi:CheY-like chemotaxis protein
MRNSTNDSAQATNRGEQQGAHDGAAGHRRSRHKRVLLVEDEWLICELITEVLQEAGFAVFPVATGSDALDYLKAGQPADILFTDLQLPGRMDGAALAFEARRIRPDLVVVYTSGGVSKVDGPVPGSRFVPKPYDPEKVSRLFAELIAA